MSNTLASVDNEAKLHKAVRSGDASEVARLINSGADNKLILVACLAQGGAPSRATRAEGETTTASSDAKALVKRNARLER